MIPRLVSVVIPTYNYGRFVGQAVDSALAQTYPHCEVIVVDDGSTDDTGEVLAPYGDRIRYIFQPNQGLSAARNTGIRAAKGEFVALLDSDDVWHPRKLEVQMHYLRDMPEVGLLATDLFMDQRSHWPAVDPSAARPVRFVLENVVGKPRFAPSSVVIRRDCFDAVGLFDVTLRCVEDRDMWIRLASRYDLAMLPLPLFWFRLHANSLSTKAVQMEEAEQRVLRKAFADTPALRGRRLLWRKVHALAALTSAQLFGASRRWDAALLRVLSSFLLWPLPFRRDEADVSFIRIRVLVVLVLRALGLRAPDAGAAATVSPPPLHALSEAPRAAPQAAPGLHGLSVALHGGPAGTPTAAH